MIFLIFNLLIEQFRLKAMSKLETKYHLDWKIRFSKIQTIFL